MVYISTIPSQVYGLVTLNVHWCDDVNGLLHTATQMYCCVPAHAHAHAHASAMQQ